MERLFQVLIDDLTNFYNSSGFGVVKFILGIYLVVLFIDIVLLLIKRGLGGDIREAISGVNLPPELTHRKKKMRVKWEKIRRRIDSGNESEYKVAVIEADNIIDDLIKRLGYPGENMNERISNIPEGQLEGIEILKEAHDIRNRIIHEEDFRLSRAEAKDVLHNYEHLLKLFEVLD